MQEETTLERSHRCYALKDCHSFKDFRELARRRLPDPIFNYIDGAADDELTYRRNTQSFQSCDLVPNILRGVENIDMSVTVMKQELAMPIYCSPTALQRIFHHEGENAVAAAANKFGTLFGVSSLGTASLTEIRDRYNGPQCYQFYFHKDRSLNRVMLENAKQAGVDVMMLTVDTITGGNRERDLRTGFAIPFNLTFRGLYQFAIKPLWAINYLIHPKYSMPQLDDFVDMSDGAISVGRYFTDMLDPTMRWDDVAEMVKIWDGQYTRKFVPELEKLPDKFLFTPWEAPQSVLEEAGIELGKDYPYPIIDLKQSRAIALEAFSSIKKE